ncbi:RNA polymerase sigma factor [Pueribacillus theae]|uniref:RNA polymerase sigma factor n=1 Tax=Pueribacillus theae TaxID=2171751 RepID=UPI0014037D75|nr:sigma-70 family RNA polymerase sigma factor [Pueribacillus theae]
MRIYIEMEKNHQMILLEQLVDRYQKQLINFSYTYVKDWGKAEDIIQEVFVSCYKHLKSFQEKSSYKTWLYTIARNKSIDHLRRERFSLFHLNLHERFKSNELSPDEVAVASDEKQELSHKVLSLPVKYRETIILFYYESLTIQEISELTKTKMSTVKTRLRRGRDLLRQAYERGEKSWRIN